VLMLWANSVEASKFWCIEQTVVKASKFDSLQEWSWRTNCGTLTPRVLMGWMDQACVYLKPWTSTLHHSHSDNSILLPLPSSFLAPQSHIVDLLKLSRSLCFGQLQWQLPVPEKQGCKLNLPIKKTAMKWVRGFALISWWRTQLRCMVLIRKKQAGKHRFLPSCTWCTLSPKP
jgi:hypothetical protein